MVTSLSALERGAREGNVVAAIEVLLDELESAGALGSSDRVGLVREQLVQIARVRASIWSQQPELAAIDLYAHTLELPELDATRERWVAELDARGPWLRALRPWRLDPCVRAELRSSPALPLERLIGLRFAGEDEVVFGCDEGELRAWSWLGTSIEPRTELEPIVSRHQRDPRFEAGDDAPRYRASPSDEARPLPWPDFGHASARLSADGRTIFVYGWYDDYDGLVEVVDADSLAVLRKHELGRPVAQVVERPGSDALLIATHGELVIMGSEGRLWARAGATGHLAWSPSGRYICTVDHGVARILDTHADSRSGPTSGLPPSFAPDGTRLVDGRELIDGQTGALVARLDLRLGQYLEGGPAQPWYHVGTELIVCIHGGLALWDARTGAAVKPGESMRVPHWQRIAYSPCGRWLVIGHRQSVQLRELPSTAKIAELELELEPECLALSADAELVAAYGAGRVEVRDRSGRLVCRGEVPEPREPSNWARLRFVADDQLRLHVPEIRSWSRERGDWVSPALTCRWSIASDPAPLLDPDIDDPLPQGWTVASGPVSSFTHTSGARTLIPCEGPWISNPRAPRLLACPGGLFELRGLAR